MSNHLQLCELQEENNLLKKIGTTEGFYQHYFENVNNFRTNIECFNYVNDKHLDLFGDYRYSSYYSFSRCKPFKNKK
jgi:hypothetical protein